MRPAKLMILLFCCAACHGSKSKDETSRYNRVYNVTGGFRNHYLDTIFRSQEPEKDANLLFPTETGKVLFRGLDEFKRLTHDQLHPYSFQFKEHDVKEVLGPAFELARAILRDPINMTRATEFNSKWLFDPMSRTVNNDCMTKCPNPDAYEPYPQPFLQAVRRRQSRRSKKTRLSSFLGRIPSRESLDQHDANRFLGTDALWRWEQFQVVRDEYRRSRQNETKRLRTRYHKAWDKHDHAELHGLEDLLQEAVAEIAEVRTEMESFFPGGPMWEWGGDHMWSSTWDMNKFDRYMHYTPDVIDPLAWFLDNYPAPFHNSGKFYYPPGGTRQWHTNVYSGGVGWRAYIVRRWPAGSTSGTFVLHPNTGKTFEIPDHDEMSINIFRIQDIRSPLWHCVYSKDAHRFSLGMKLADTDVFKILTQTGVAIDSGGELEGISDSWNAKYDVELKKIEWREGEERRVFTARKKFARLREERDNLTAAVIDAMGGDELAAAVADRVAGTISAALAEKLAPKVLAGVANITENRRNKAAAEAAAAEAAAAEAAAAEAAAAEAAAAVAEAEAKHAVSASSATSRPAAKDTDP